MSDPTRSPLPADNIHPIEFDAGFTENPAYAEALTHLYGRLNTEALDPAQFARFDRSLDSYRAFLREFNDPHSAAPAIHITGTRGKGSSLAMLEAILLAADYKTGMTVSPHLVEVRERIRIAGNDISRDSFARHYQTIRPVADRMMNQANYRTVFELLTALAFLVFREEAVDAALVEVGMGGRLDATNVVSPVLSIVTRIGLDHTHILGDTVELIADDKGQIIKPGAPAIVSRQTGGALQVLEARCAEVRVPLWRLDHEIRLEQIRLSESETRFSVHTPCRSHLDLSTPLLGAHQAENAAIAVAAADRLDADGHFQLSLENIRAGLTETRWPGRAEILTRNPLLIIDGAHTDQGATVLAATLDALYPQRERIMILGMNRDKHPDQFLDCFPHPPRLVLATRADSPRSLDAEELAEIVRGRGISCETVPLRQALDTARRMVLSNELIIGTGSFYVIGALRRDWLRAMNGDSTLRNRVG